MLAGYRTLIVNGALVIGAAILHYIVGADLSAVNPAVATIIVSGANIGLRFLTTTPVGTPPLVTK